MSYVPRPYGTRGVYAPRPLYAARAPFTRPYYGPPVGYAAPGMGSSVGSGALAGTLGALGGTLGCLLCLAAIGALGLFATVIAITAYAKKLLDEFKIVNNIDQTNNGVLKLNVGVNILLVASFFYIFVRRMMQSV